MKLKKIKGMELITIGLSLIAITISVRSCSISRKALEISQQEYLDKFKNVWTGVYDKDNETIKIIPTNKNVILQKATAYYPDIISDDNWPIRPPENLLHISSPKFQIREIIADSILPETGKFKVLDTSRIPIIIESNYTLNGDNLYDTSVYMIEFMGLIKDDGSKPHVDISGIVFSHQIKENTDLKKYINNLWNNEIVKE
ncbi:hypothetical protein [Flagellimonas sp. CMM7]|uniref:hypothetical protein n=1 Tax=Flagellimonas sp. CMM7 TaxID=2654676 RepID=UPI0013D32C95|nr:hypothetical protein [Flagellimonas sp. CMM7]UII81074.1 hypothetical protein LV704_06050 [Flagellimonas sp. CMM7]